jgi:hypothetical protein
MGKSKKSKKDQLDLGNELLGTRLGEAHNHSQKKSGTDRFLTGIQLRPLVSGGMPGSKPLGFALGQGQAPLEVVAMKSATQPPVTAMRTAWKDRHGGRCAAPVLLVAIYGNRAAICGPSGENPTVLTNVELSQADFAALEKLKHLRN